jgi:hypothetical protein
LSDNFPIQNGLKQGDFIATAFQFCFRWVNNIKIDLGKMVWLIGTSGELLWMCLMSLSGCTASGVSSSAQPHRVSYLEIWNLFSWFDTF